MFAALLLAAAAGSSGLIGRAALACGDSEAPISCSADTMAEDARWLVKRVHAALQADTYEALRRFSAGQNGFRTVELYVFCIGPDGKITAHPNPALLGQEMADEEFGQMPEIALKEPVWGLSPMLRRSDREARILATAYVTHVAGQVCGIGQY